MMNLRFSSHEFLLTALMALMVLPGPVFADEHDDDDDSGGESMSILLARPEWLSRVDAIGRSVGISGSKSKFREDQNIQSGITLGTGIYDESEDGRILFFEGLGQPDEEQGYGRFLYEKRGGLSFDAELQGWTEFYNTRPGVKDVTVLGTRINDTGIFPNTTDSRSLFGGGKPSVDWLTTTAGVQYELPGSFNDVYLDLTYRKIDGEMSLVKGGTVFDPGPPPVPLVGGSGPGTVFFDFPGRKDVDYETYGGQIGTRATLAGLAWRFDASVFRHEIKSETREANFGIDAASSDLESFNEDSEVDVYRVNLVGSRQLTHELFFYLGGVYSVERSDPEPFQIAQTGLSPAATSRQETRRATQSSDVKRYSGAFNTGLVFQPWSSLVMTVDAGVRASKQDADLVELRSESSFSGPDGTVTNSSDRDHLSLRARADVSWKATPKLSFKLKGRYRYSKDEIDSSRISNLTPGTLPSEIEDYDITRHKFNIRGSSRYRLRAGRRIEAGYEFMYEASETDVDQLVNQFVIGNYERLQHRAFAKASGRISKKLRGELRFQYVFEYRDMDEPDVDIVVTPSAREGEIEFQGFTIMPTLTYQHSATLSGYSSISVGRQQYELENAGAEPVGFNSTFSSFEYEVVSTTATLGINWSPTELFSGSATYTVFNNDESVRNIGQNAVIRGLFKIAEDWDLSSSVRWLGYDPDGNSLDDYNAIIFTFGVAGRF